MERNVVRARTRPSIAPILVTAHCPADRRGIANLVHLTVDRSLGRDASSAAIHATQGNGLGVGHVDRAGGVVSRVSVAGVSFSGVPARVHSESCRIGSPWSAEFTTND